MTTVSTLGSECLFPALGGRVACFPALYSGLFSVHGSACRAWQQFTVSRTWHQWNIFVLSSDWFIEWLAFKGRNAIGFALLRYTVSSGRRSSATTDILPYYDSSHLSYSNVIFKTKGGCLENFNCLPVMTFFFSDRLDLRIRAPVGIRLYW